MTTINDNYINALLADSSYVDGLTPNLTGDNLGLKLIGRITKSGVHEIRGHEVRGQVFHYEIATLSQLHNPVNARAMQANACEFELERTDHNKILAKYDN